MKILVQIDHVGSCDMYIINSMEFVFSVRFDIGNNRGLKSRIGRMVKLGETDRIGVDK